MASSCFLEQKSCRDRFALQPTADCKALRLDCVLKEGPIPSDRELMDAGSVDELACVSRIRRVSLLDLPSSGGCSFGSGLGQTDAQPLLMLRMAPRETQKFGYLYEAMYSEG